jgi:hypothetical protein
LSCWFCSYGSPDVVVDKQITLLWWLQVHIWNQTWSERTQNDFHLSYCSFVLFYLICKILENFR